MVQLVERARRRAEAFSILWSYVVPEEVVEVTYPVRQHEIVQ